MQAVARFATDSVPAAILRLQQAGKLVFLEIEELAEFITVGREMLERLRTNLLALPSPIVLSTPGFCSPRDYGGPILRQRCAIHGEPMSVIARIGKPPSLRPMQSPLRHIADIALPDAGVRDEQYLDGTINLVPHIISDTFPTVAARIICGGPSAPVDVGSRVHMDNKTEVKLVVMSFNDTHMHNVELCHDDRDSPWFLRPSPRAGRAPSAHVVRAVSARRPRRLSAPSLRAVSAPSLRAVSARRPRRLPAPSAPSLRAPSAPCLRALSPRAVSVRCLSTRHLRAPSAPSPRAVHAVSARRPHRPRAPSLRAVSARCPRRLPAPSAPSLRAPSALVCARRLRVPSPRAVSAEAAWRDGVETARTARGDGARRHGADGARKRRRRRRAEGRCCCGGCCFVCACAAGLKRRGAAGGAWCQ